MCCFRAILARAGQNALRHALSTPVRSDPGLSDEVEALAREIAGSGANIEIQALARQVAEAQIDLRRVRYARHQLLSEALADPNFRSLADHRSEMGLVKRLLKAIGPYVPIPAAEQELLTARPKGPEKFA